VDNYKNLKSFLKLSLSALFLADQTHGFSSLSVGAFQGYQVVYQKEDLYRTNSTLASMPTVGGQFLYQRAFMSRFGFRLKAELIKVKYFTPPNGFLSAESFHTLNVTSEIPYQLTTHTQTFLKIGKKERVLYNLNDALRLSLYKAKIDEYGLGFNFDSQNLGGLVLGASIAASYLKFKSQDINGIVSYNSGYEAEVRGKFGWILENGWGQIFRANFSYFSMPADRQENTGKEIRFFGEIIKSF
jgi:hypothetical protein